MTKDDLANLRYEYTRDGLEESAASPDPFVQFGNWFAQAREVSSNEPHAMTVATATSTGLPSARTLLLKEFDHQGFVFYTNYESAKGDVLDENPVVALLFYWPELERQVRICGVVEKVDRTDAAAYFANRPRGSQIGAHASRQSEVIANREVLETAVQRYEAEFADSAVPIPDWWGGYRVIPDEFEFWQGRPSRLHDRLRFRKSGSEWVCERLSP